MRMETEYESTTLGDAAVLLEAYRDELADNGMHEQARALTGLEVFDVSAAEAAIMILKNLPVAKREPEGLRFYAITALQKAVERTRLDSINAA